MLIRVKVLQNWWGNLELGFRKLLSHTHTQTKIHYKTATLRVVTLIRSSQISLFENRFKNTIRVLRSTQIVKCRLVFVSILPQFLVHERGIRGRHDTNRRFPCIRTHTVMDMLEGWVSSERIIITSVVNGRPPV